MIPCLAFLNELSYTYHDDKAPAEVLPILLSTLKAIKAVQRIRQDLVIAGSSTISKVAIGGGAHSVASLLSGDTHKDEWRFITGLDQASPGDDSWNFNRPHPLQEVTFEGQRTFGMLWAGVTRSLVFSLALAPPWRSNQIRAQLEEMSALAEIITTEIIIPNVSAAEHADHHRELITNYGRDESASSVIYRDDEFVARIYFFDHNPPHFHVCSSADPSTTLATYTIETLDILNGKITGRLQRLVREWANGQTAQLMDNWTRCRSGEHPFLLNS